MKAEVRDEETGEILPLGSTGEAWVTGPNMFDGYFREPELTSQVFDDRGYFRTGDIVNIDEAGRVTFVGGSKICSKSVVRMLLLPRSRDIY